MNNPLKKIKLYYPEVSIWLQNVLEVAEDNIRLDKKKHAVHLLNEDYEKILTLKFPLPYPAIEEEESITAYQDRIPEDIVPYVILLIQAGASAMGYFENGEVVAHKADKKYMIRQKRGKAQLAYLKTRGKSKAGSRIRLANTVRFIEEINERMTDWEELYEPERILYSCSATLWGMLFQAKIPPPFEKKDPRLIKIPEDVNIPTHEELLKINELVQSGTILIWKEAAESYMLG